MQRAEQQGRGKQLDSLEFQLEQARLAVLLADDANTVLQEYKSLAAKPQAGPADHYGLALANWRTGANDIARSQLLKLMNNDPDRILYRTTLAQVLQDSGQQAEALALYQDTLNLYPGDLVVGQYYAAALLLAGKAEQARDLAREMVRDEQGRTPAVYELWAKAASVSGPPWETNRASAELYYLNGDLPLAVDQLEQALRHSDVSRYDQERIQARLGEFREIMAERAKK
jgi:predicted Zn-dependent protease